MSWLKLRQLLPARKAWKVFTTKLQSKLKNLNRSKAIKKHKNQINTSKSVLWPSTPSRYRFKRQKGRLQPSYALQYHRRYHLQKRSKPIYIDQLFQAPASPVKETEAGSKGPIERGSTSDQQLAVRGTIKEDDNMGKNHSADDLWESLVLASPQMHGINERAEEFIARFRAERQQQEKLAHHL